MRSTVSYMLSHGSGEPTMSRPDYEQCAYHHGCLLVLLRGIGPSKPRSLQKVFEKVRRVNTIKITGNFMNAKNFNSSCLLVLPFLTYLTKILPELKFRISKSQLYIMLEIFDSFTSTTKHF